MPCINSKWQVKGFLAYPLLMKYVLLDSASPTALTDSISFRQFTFLRATDYEFCRIVHMSVLECHKI